MTAIRTPFDEDYAPRSYFNYVSALRLASFQAAIASENLMAFWEWIPTPVKMSKHTPGPWSLEQEEFERSGVECRLDRLVNEIE